MDTPFVDHVMLDLETMGNGPDGAIVAIGACRFSGQGVGETFYRNVDLESAVKWGGTMTPSTIMWWLKQSEEARSALTEAKPIPMSAALADFSLWLGQHPFAGLWGNGVDFDNVLLRSAYQGCGIALPWSYKLNRCYRTVKALYPNVLAVGVPKLIAHRADHDAVWQARHLIEINHFSTDAKIL